MKLILEKTKIKPYHLFYFGFFLVYFFFLYFSLYHLSELQPFQLNIHFFSNVIGSLSKRFLSEASIYGFIFFLLFYTQVLWKRILLIGLFSASFLINTLSIGYYLLHQSNWQPGTLDISPVFILFSVLMIVITLVIDRVLKKLKNNSEDIWVFKRNLFGSLLLIIAILTPIVPISYSAHRSLLTTQENVENIFRVVHLETSGTTHLYEILTGTYRPTIVPDISAFDFKIEAGE